MSFLEDVIAKSRLAHRRARRRSVGGRDINVGYPLMPISEGIARFRRQTVRTQPRLTPIMSRGDHFAEWRNMIRWGESLYNLPENEEVEYVVAKLKMRSPSVAYADGGYLRRNLEGGLKKMGAN